MEWNGMECNVLQCKCKFTCKCECRCKFNVMYAGMYACVYEVRFLCASSCSDEYQKVSDIGIGACSPLSSAALYDPCTRHATVHGSPLFVLLLRDSAREWVGCL